MTPVMCPYCGSEAALVSGKQIWTTPPKYYDPQFKARQNRNYYQCSPCNARVGCHPGTNISLGKPAKQALRSLRNQVHEVFDPIWKDEKMARLMAYDWLAMKLKIPRDDAHIGHFDEKTCMKVISILKNFETNMRL